MRDQFTQRYRGSFSNVTVLALFPLLFAPIVPAQDFAWSPTGGPTSDSYVRVVRIDPVNPNILYAGLVVDDSHQTAGIWKSTDGGNTWNSISNGLPTTTGIGIYDIEINPSNTSILFAANDAYDASSGGLYGSLDGGNTWTLLSAPANWGYMSIAVDPLVPSTVYVGTDRWGLLKSVDGGNSWTPANIGLPSRATVRSLAIDPQNDSNVYAGTDGSGLFKSTDGGASWNAVNSGLPDGAGIGVISFSPVTSSTLFVGIDGSFDSTGGVFTSVDGGNTWTTAGTGLPTDNGVHTIAIDSVTPTLMYTGSFGGGIYYSTDGGNTWGDFNSGLSDPYIHSIVINPQNHNMIYAGSCNSGVWLFLTQ